MEAYSLRKRKIYFHPADPTPRKKRKIQRRTKKRVNPLATTALLFDKDEFSNVGERGAEEAEKIQKLVGRKLLRAEVHPIFQSEVFDPYLLHSPPSRKLLETVRLGRLAIAIQTYLPPGAWKLSLLQRWHEKNVTPKALKENWPENAKKLLFEELDRRHRPVKVFNEFFSAFFDFLCDDPFALGNLRLVFPQEKFARRILVWDFQRKQNCLQILNNLYAPVISDFLEGDRVTVTNLFKVFKGEPFTDDAINCLDIPSSVRKYIKVHVREWMANDAGKNAEEINTFFRERQRSIGNFIQRAETYPRHALCGRDAAIAHIKTLFLETPAQRRQKLIAALAPYGVTLRGDSRLGQGFINGNIGYALDEVVAILRITNKLFQYSHVAWSNNHDSWENRLRAEVLQRNHSWTEACGIVCAITPFIPPPRSYDYSDDDYYDDWLI